MIWTIFKKEMKDSLRDSKTLLLGVLLPILLLFFMTILLDKVLLTQLQVDSLRIVVLKEIPEEALKLFSGTLNLYM
ncbi:hypothetical protein [Aneurinibacillus migulanus]|uniref:Uncharacterized protein n=1 Tax=Aneurinibacillus migulanus TaxID=47500 RepID=A0A0D1UUI5_ANEMI|nr:hypothetical protein [Aneurinibacillus migulanus]KIV50629.1 hypothetical protein TS65_29480 [Aneurinibacillus migulanus]KON97440.1 hypothetical protein AF333_20185 [Aneurinibacillus migulanus]MED1619716.1 hypothetical protein [Aneurinibacillus migulanus]SDK49516.1 hypothetical protein SAMN04487909_16113 [Aneurinibacillus migulanus]GED17502.1 hypothetical protein AMI01nite_54930 [Aneurinibacillus migulanus]